MPTTIKWAPVKAWAQTTVRKYVKSVPIRAHLCPGIKPQGAKVVMTTGEK